MKTIILLCIFFLLTSCGSDKKSNLAQENRASDVSDPGDENEGQGEEEGNTPTLSVDVSSLSDINSTNVSDFTLEGSCSEEGRSVQVSVGESLIGEATCQGGAWSLRMDLTSLNKVEGSIAIKVDHSNAEGFSAPQILESVTNNFICPENFIAVPSLAGYTTLSFCVAKHEMKSNESDEASANPYGSPYININKDEAVALCLGMGSGHDLITNDEWQSIARNIESVPSNWEGSIIGSPGGINQGHSDGLPDERLSATEDDGQACAGTGESCDSGTWNSQKRTHRLSNGEIIWDFSGNVWEWIKDENDQGYGKQSYISQVTESSHSLENSLRYGRTRTARRAKDQFGPSGSYTDLDSPPYGGLGQGDFRRNSGAVYRGGYWRGYWNSQSTAGIFAIGLDIETGFRFPTLGFRCIYTPDAPLPQISIDRLPDVTSENAFDFTLEGQCTENGETVTVSLSASEEKKPKRSESLCSNDTWEAKFELTDWSHERLLTVEVNHASSDGFNVPPLKETLNNTFICPPNFLGVPPMGGYITHSFCVAKYEMKGEGEESNAVSTPTGTPLVDLNQGEAFLKCNEKGEGYDLITNDQWQSIARNIEVIPSNWQGGLPGSSGGINQGHSDSSPYARLEASDDDSQACIGTEQTCDDNTWNNQKRTHKLNNGEVIWDFSGNATEWIKDYNTYSYGEDAYISKVTRNTHTDSRNLTRGTTQTVRIAKDQFGPLGDYSSTFSNNYFGLGHGQLNYSSGAVTRGGSALSAKKAGVFHTSLVSFRESGFLGPFTGFRCVYNSGRPVPRLSIDERKLEDIDSSNVSLFTISGSCSEERGLVFIDFEGVSGETYCSGGSWTASFDLTGLSQIDGAVSIRVDHASFDGRSAPRITTSVTNNFNCPAQFVGVPSLPDYTTHGFCIAKYEMKKGSNFRAVSQAAGTPYVNLRRKTAREKCDDLGDDYSLITNDEWQSVARHIESVPRNWQDGYVGGTALNRGHTDKSPERGLAANPLDYFACYGTGATCHPEQWDIQRRTHFLPSGEVVWDLAGNVLEWVRDGSDFSYSSSNNVHVSSITRENHKKKRSLKWGLTTTPRVAKDQFGPSGDYTYLDSGYYGGLGMAWLKNVGGTVTRGGHWIQHAGIFNAILDYNHDNYAEFIGFRCVYRP